MTFRDELVRRVTERLLTVEQTRRFAPVLTEEAATDARQLLIEAAPAPDQAVVFGPVILALYTFYYRAVSDVPHPTAMLDGRTATALYIFLRHELADTSVLPTFPREVTAVPLDESERHSSFALVVAGACALAANDALQQGSKPTVWNTLTQGIDWLRHWHAAVRVRHANYPDIVCLLSVLYRCRFEEFADPRDFQAAVEFALAACRHTAPSHARVGVQLPNMLEIVVEGVWMIGYPDLAVAEDITRRSGIEPLAQTLARLKHVKELREVIESTTDIPAQAREAHIALLMCQALVFKGDLPPLSCVVARLETALTAFQEGHPYHGPALWLLHRGYERLDRDPSELPEPDAAGRFYGAAMTLSALFDLPEGTTPPADELAGLIDRLLPLGEELAVGRGPSGLPAEVRAAIAFMDSIALAREDPKDRPIERIGRYRRALEALAPHHPARLSYSLILGSEALSGSAALTDTDPAGSELLAGWAQDAIANIASIVPEDEDPGVLKAVRSGDLETSFLFALLMLPLSWSPETRQIFEAIDSEALVFVAGVFGAAAKHVGDTIEDGSGEFQALRHLIGLTGYGGERSLEDNAEDVDLLLTLFAQNPEQLAELSRAGGNLLAARVGRAKLGSIPQETLAKVATVLQKVYDATDQPSWLLEDRLAGVWTQMGLMRMDPTMFMMADVISQESDTARRLDDRPDAITRFYSALNRVNLAVYSYMFTHEPAELERARAAIPALLDLARAADAEQGATTRENQVRAEMIRDLADVIGPGGGPKEDITEEVLVRCRATYENAPEGLLRMFTAGNLTRALLSRSSALRKTDPRAAVRLIEEASALQGPLSGTGLQQELMSKLAAITLPGARVNSETSQSAPALPDELVQFGPLGEIMEILGASATETFGSVEHGQADVKAMRSPLIPIWFRAQIGILAALEAANTYPDGVRRALEIGSEAVGLLEQLTDRGGSEQSAEHSLMSFDGRVRQLATLVAHNVRIPRVMLAQESRPLGDAYRELADIFHQLAQVYEAADAQGVSLPLPPSLPATLSDPSIDSVVATLERGRGLLLTRRLESRADLGPLRAAHPELARRFEDLTARLRSADGPVQGRARVDRRRASKEFDELVAQIRAKTGFEDFLTPQSPERLRALASQGPIVVLDHVDDFYCVAFLITEDEIRSCYLEVEGNRVTANADRLARAIEACHARGRRRPGPSELDAMREEITDVFSWSWHKIVQPVLDRLGCFEPGGPDGKTSHVWWVPTGSFNTLPLHAVQCVRENCTEGRCGSALDTVVSSFVPGLQTLAHCRARAARGTGGEGMRALVVAETDDVLPGAVAAAEYVTSVLGAEGALIGEAATREAVLGALEHSPWVQFGCHAHSSPDLPAGSWIQLPGGERLSVADIYRTRPESARMAVLTACGTARAAERLADEAVPVTSAFLLAGYPTVVGTLWEVDSTQIERFLRGFYARVLDGSSTAAHAVHHAARDLRNQFPDRPHVWAAYVHAGH